MGNVLEYKRIFLVVLAVTLVAVLIDTGMQAETSRMFN
jgi:hypothetical protein